MKQTHVLAVLGGIGVLAIRPQVKLRADTVSVALGPEEVIASMRTRFESNPDVIASGADNIVSRFAGRAGPFSYRTTEVVSFDSRGVGFEHITGPFASCTERFEVTGSGQSTEVEHTGQFVMRGGLLGWALGIGPVRRAFENHVGQHLRQMSGELAS